MASSKNTKPAAKKAAPKSKLAQKRKADAAPKRKIVRPDILKHLRWIRDESMIVGDSWMQMSMVEANPKVTVIVGENASGKSLIFRLLNQLVSQDGATAVQTSIRARAEAGIPRAMMYGDENEQSTGATTAGWIMAAIERNLDRKEGSILALDEPELGLSEGYARALGVMVGEASKKLPRTCGGIVIVTHSKAFVSGLVEALSKAPTFVTMSDEPMTAAQWLAAEEVRTVDELLTLKEKGHERWLAIHKLLKD